MWLSVPLSRSGSGIDLVCERFWIGDSIQCIDCGWDVVLNVATAVVLQACTTRTVCSAYFSKVIFSLNFECVHAWSNHLKWGINRYGTSGSWQRDLSAKNSPDGGLSGNFWLSLAPLPPLSPRRGWQFLPVHVPSPAKYWYSHKPNPHLYQRIVLCVHLTCPWMAIGRTPPSTQCLTFELTKLWK